MNQEYDNTIKVSPKRNIVFLLKPKSTVAYLESDSTIRQGLEKMRYYGYTAIPVIDKQGKYVGTINEGDFLWNMVDKNEFELKEQEHFFIKDIIRQGWTPAVTINTDMSDLVPRIMEQNFVPVVDDFGIFMGIITRKSIIQYFYDLSEK